MKALRPALQDKQFSPAYYLHGEDDFLKEEALRHLIEVAVDPATRDFNLDQRKGAELDAAALSTLLATPPMMAERRMVVIRDAATMRKESLATVQRYLTSPATDLLLVLTAPADAKPDKTLTERSVSVDCKHLSGVQLPKWIVARVEKHLGGRISDAAVELLQDTVGSDLTELATTLDKLAAFAGKREIDEDAVSALVGARRDETPGALLDAVAMRDTALAVSLVPGVLRQPKTSAVQLVMALTTQMLALATSHARRTPTARLSNEYWALLKAGGQNYTGRSWGEAVSSWTRANDRWNATDLEHALAVLLQTDLALKSSRVSSDEQILQTAVLSICGAVGHRAAA
jgi:DNA polymerase-3 subunit delta